MYNGFGLETKLVKNYKLWFARSAFNPEISPTFHHSVVHFNIYSLLDLCTRFLDCVQPLSRWTQTPSDASVPFPSCAPDSSFVFKKCCSPGFPSFLHVTKLEGAQFVFHYKHKVCKEEQGSLEVLCDSLSLSTSSPFTVLSLTWTHLYFMVSVVKCCLIEVDVGWECCCSTTQWVWSQKPEFPAAWAPQWWRWWSRPLRSSTDLNGTSCAGDPSSCSEVCLHPPRWSGWSPAPLHLAGGSCLVPPERPDSWWAGWRH